MDDMDLLKFAFVWTKENYNAKLKYLASMAMDEDWDYTVNPQQDFPILRNYVRHLFKKLYLENKISYSDNGDFSAFNTGLVTKKHEEIFMLFEKNTKCNVDPEAPEWFFKGFFKESDMEMCVFTEPPKRANFFTNPADLIYDTSKRLVIYYEHIIWDNIARFPEDFQNSLMKTMLLKWAVDMAIKRIERNYKIAVPQYSVADDKIQLLLPICLHQPEKADLALVVSLVEESWNAVYKAFTCLTLDMAINNARLICKPDNEWLKA